MLATMHGWRNFSTAVIASEGAVRNLQVRFTRRTAVNAGTAPLLKHVFSRESSEQELLKQLHTAETLCFNSRYVKSLQKAKFEDYFLSFFLIRNWLLRIIQKKRTQRNQRG